MFSSPSSKTKRKLCMLLSLDLYMLLILKRIQAHNNAKYLVKKKKDRYLLKAIYTEFPKCCKIPKIFATTTPIYYTIQ